MARKIRNNACESYYNTLLILFEQEEDYVIPADGHNGIVTGTEDYVIPVDGETATSEGLQILSPPGYSELDLNSPVARETANAHVYQKLLRRDSDYVIPANPEPEYEEVKIVTG